MSGCKYFCICRHRQGDSCKKPIAPFKIKGFFCNCNFFVSSVVTGKGHHHYRAKRTAEGTEYHRGKRMDPSLPHLHEKVVNISRNGLKNSLNLQNIIGIPIYISKVKLFRYNSFVLG